MIVCFTGHRRVEPGNVNETVSFLCNKIEELAGAGEVCFRTGGALGFDTIAALCVISAREKHPDVRLSLILPCRNQTRGWRDADIEKYDYILSQADDVRYVCEHYTPYCMKKRNRELVDGADLCIAYCNKSSGGSAYTIAYANERGVRVENLYI